jgi:peroxiredoxin
MLLKSLIYSLILIQTNAWAISIGDKAPHFSLPNEENQIIDLKNYQGKYVILEWLNHGCPFVKKHYSVGNMQKIQKELQNDRVVWFSIISSAKGKQGHSTPAEALADKKRVGSNALNILIDEDGKVGGQYGAKTTPHMFIINPQGVIVYEGAIDSIASTDSADITKSTNYIIAAFENITNNENIKTPKTKAYGCSVKY